MDKLLCVMWMNDVSEGYDLLSNSVSILSAAAGNHNLTRLFPAPYGMEDDVFLQHTIIAEGGFA